MKKQEIKKLTKDEIVKNISKFKKICSILDFKKSILKFLTLQKLVKQKKLLLG